MRDPPCARIALLALIQSCSADRCLRWRWRLGQPQAPGSGGSGGGGGGGGGRPSHCLPRPERRYPDRRRRPGGADQQRGGQHTLHNHNVLRARQHDQLSDHRPHRSRYRLLRLEDHLVGDQPDTARGAAGEDAGVRRPIAECTMFGDGYSWGSMRTADLQISSEKAAGLPMQVIGDPNFANVPSDCSSTGGRQRTQCRSVRRQWHPRRRPVCAGLRHRVRKRQHHAAVLLQLPDRRRHMHRHGQVPLNQQATNPVSALHDRQQRRDRRDALPSGCRRPDGDTGALVFGIGTQSNNMSGQATVLTTDTQVGYITIRLQGHDVRAQLHRQRLESVLTSTTARSPPALSAAARTRLLLPEQPSRPSPPPTWARTTRSRT